MPPPDRPRRLLLVISNLRTLGGMEIQLAHLANGLAGRGHEVTLASIRSRAEDGAGADHGPAIDPRVQLVHLGATGREAQLPALRRLRRMARGSDLVHCTGWDASLWGRLAGIAARRPVVMAEHTPGREHQLSPSGAPRGPYIAAHNRLLDPFTASTVICAEWQRDILAGEGVRPAKMTLIPNGVPVDELRRQARAGITREALGIPADAKVVTHVARFRAQKRQLLTLETVARLRETMGDVRVVFAGAGPDLESVQEAARAMGADWATFLGRHDNVPSVFALGDLTVLPSTGEAMPMSIIEAIGVGVPIVAADVGDVGPILERTGAGLLFPAEDPDSFLAACATVLSDPEVHRRLTQAALAAETEVDAQTMVRRYEDLFASIGATANGSGDRARRPRWRA
jgi:glycosyltransferase involved in cell wall biosynthesis